MSILKGEKELEYVYVSDEFAKWNGGIFCDMHEVLGDCLRVIPGCKDYWARDFMPFNTADGHLLSFSYTPDYLKRTHEDDEFQTNQKELLYDVGLYGARPLLCRSRFSGEDIETRTVVMDGGNMVDCGDRVIMCDKIILENNIDSCYADRFKKQLESQLKAEVVFVPWDYTEEAFGHADGYVTYLGNNRVLMTKCSDTPQNHDFKSRLRKSLELGGFEVVEFGLKGAELNNDWIYINYVQWQDKILMPGAGLLRDDDAQKFISEAAGVPLENVIRIEVKESLSRFGGSLHCCTWNSDKLFGMSFDEYQSS